MDRMDVDNQAQRQQQAVQPPPGFQGNQPRYMMGSFGPPEVDPSEIEFMQQIGNGSFGAVWAGRCRQKDVAIKVLAKQDFDEKTLEAFRHEVEIMSKIFHPNVNLFMGACTVPGKTMIVTELMRGDLERLILEEQVNLSLLTRMKLARDAALGMLWLHNSNPQIIHRDLKASNLLVDDNLNCKICDFGLSQFTPKGKNLVDGKEGAKGTPLWMAPEVMMGEPFNEKADIYSFGLILWFLLTKREPYEEYDDLEKFTRDICLRKVRPPLPSDCDPTLRELIVQCWAHDPRVRPHFDEIITKIEHIMVDLAIEDPLGRKFWKHYFLKKDTVTWADFINAFGKVLDLVPAQYRNHPMNFLLTQHPEVLDEETELNIRCLKSILADESNKNSSLYESEDEYVVKFEKFGNILKWFGPLTTKPHPNGVSILDRIRQLLMQEWFHGDISTNDSEDRLMHKPEGTFLVRFSTSSPGAYTVSKVSSPSSSSSSSHHHHQSLPIKHQKILSKNGGFEINNRAYRSLQELIAAEREDLRLVFPCSGSRFLSLFMEQKVSGYVEER